MNAETNRDLWTRYVDGQNLDSAEYSALIASIIENGELSRQWREDVAIDRLVRLIAVPGQQTFVDACLVRFANLQPAAAERHEFGIDIVPSTNRTGGNRIQIPVKRRRIRRGRSVLISAILATASLILVTCIVLVTNRNRAELPNRTEVAPGNFDVAKEHEREPRETPVVKSPQELPSLVKDETDKSEAPEVPQTANASTDVRSAEESDPEIQNPQLVDAMPRDVEEPLDSGPLFATVTQQANAKWLSDPINGRLGVGSHKLVFGSATIVMDNDLSIRLVGPAEIRFLSGRQLGIESGKVQFESPSGLADFTVETPDALLSNLLSPSVFVFVDAEGSEVVLSSGRMELVRRTNEDEHQSVEPMRIGTDGLQHVFVKAGSEKNSLPSIAIAHGSGKYLAQIGLMDRAVQVSDPRDFDSLFDRIRLKDLTEALRANPQRSNLLEKINRFNAMIRQIHSLPPDAQNPVALRHGYSFQGEITIDGNRVEFSTPEEYRNFLDELNRGN